MDHTSISTPSTFSSLAWTPLYAWYCYAHLRTSRHELTFKYHAFCTTAASPSRHLARCDSTYLYTPLSKQSDLRCRILDEVDWAAGLSARHSPVSAGCKYSAVQLRSFGYLHCRCAAWSGQVYRLTRPFSASNRRGSNIVPSGKQAFPEDVEADSESESTWSRDLTTSQYRACTVYNRSSFALQATAN